MLWHGNIRTPFQVFLIYNTKVSTRSPTRWEEFENDVPESTLFAIGYYEGQTKRWICSDDDLSMLYEVHAKYPDKEILLWCEGREKDCDRTSSKAKRKKTTNDGGSKSKREEKEDRVKLIAEELHNA